MVTTGAVVRATFWKFISSLLETGVVIRPRLLKAARYWPYVTGGLAAFLLGSFAGQLLIYLIY